MQEISKKELLEVTGISYGQLYRWKREGLIPEEWFTKRSSYTGQETFFPRVPMLERVTTIQNMKGTHSLEEIAAHLDGQLTSVCAPEALGMFTRIPEEVCGRLKVSADKARLTANGWAVLGAAWLAAAERGLSTDQAVVFLDETGAALTKHVASHQASGPERSA
ncbi:MAG: YhbD family protein [Coriobacteriales bacterium]|jgi:hypothetical protein|nr:YhbD family protein [Coriobacteriales bacterium]